MKRLYVIVFAWVLLSMGTTNAQQLIGTEGMLNIPTADMHSAGTFNGGVSYVGKALLSEHYNYNTGLYYVSFTPFNWIEMTFRETLLKTKKREKGIVKEGFYQQDRSTSFRSRPVKEKEHRWWPSVVIGCNDIYSDHGDSYYTSVYGALTKHFALGQTLKVGVTAGYASPFRRGEVYDGFFGGVEIRSGFMKNMRLMAEYDTKGVNVGAQILLLRHLNIMVMTRELDKFGAAVSYQYTIKY